MNVYVPRINLEDGPADLALRMEDIVVRPWPCRQATDYGTVFSYVWDCREPFIVVEHDIVPWPGAVKALWDCPEPWCTHAYPLHRGNVALSFGIGKYVPFGPAPEEWRETEWRMLDGQVIPHLRKLYGAPHVHTPAVAHARANG